MPVSYNASVSAAASHDHYHHFCGPCVATEPALLDDEPSIIHNLLYSAYRGSGGMVDTLGLGSSGASCGGSSPSIRILHLLHAYINANIS